MFMQRRDDNLGLFSHDLRTCTALRSSRAGVDPTRLGGPMFVVGMVGKAKRAAILAKIIVHGNDILEARAVI